MFVIQYRKIWYVLSVLLLGASLYCIFAYGFNTSIDFKGGTITEASYAEGRPQKEEVEGEIDEMSLGGYSVRPSGTDRYIIRTRELTEAERTMLREALSIHGTYEPVIERSNTIGPIAGEELRNKAVTAIIIVILMIVLFITFAFRKVSEPVSSWKYGFATVIALLHDIIIPLGIFVFLGKFYGTEIDLLFVTGLLAILGYSVHDSIVVFDRVRENLRINQEKGMHENFETTLGKSVAQTFGRSINTSVTIFITLFALYLFGPETTKEFSFLLTLGVIIGTYSSIFIASPLLLTFYSLQGKQQRI